MWTYLTFLIYVYRFLHVFFFYKIMNICCLFKSTEGKKTFSQMCPHIPLLKGLRSTSLTPCHHANLSSSHSHFMNMHYNVHSFVLSVSLLKTAHCSWSFLQSRLLSRWQVRPHLHADQETVPGYVSGGLRLVSDKLWYNLSAIFVTTGRKHMSTQHQ